jgi:hypothetical protein
MIFNRIPARFRTFFTGCVIGLLCLLIPLLRDFHWESAGLAALIAAFYAAIMTAAGSKKTIRIFRDTSGLLIGWAIPLVIFAVATNCMSFDGIAFWIFGPFPSMLLGWAIGRLVKHFDFTYRKTTVSFILITIATIPTLIEFLSFPQLYFFNHIWSYWPGPIYDEIVHFDGRLILFRGITLFWILILWALPFFYDDKMYRWITLLSLLAIIFSYLNSSNWGLIAPEERIQAELGGVIETDHFRIFFTATSTDPDTLTYWQNMHEEHLRSIIETLEIDPSVYQTDKIHSYIYYNSDQKKRLTGAGQTSYVPVWISQDQTHIAQSHLNRVLKHELVHIAGKQFGNWFGASINIGLIEGLAVALDTNRYRSSIDQLVAAREEWPDADDLQRMFSPLGFYSAAGPISYVISGSFVKHLIDHYPVESFKKAYRTGNIEYAYAPLTFEDLTAGWHQYLENVDLEEEDIRRSAALFRTPSIFDKPCPRVDRQRSIGDQLTMDGNRYRNEMYIQPC